jgi:hypothetical protein
MNEDKIVACLPRTICKAVNTPRLAAAPSARVGVTLSCMPRDDGTSGRIIVDDVERRP